MSRIDFEEIREELDLESWLEDQGITFKTGQGSSGRQLNVRECPACANRGWKVYLNADSGLGNCFSCDMTFNKAKFIHSVLGGSWVDTFANISDFLRGQGWRPKRMSAAAVDAPTVKLPTSFALPNAEGQNLPYLENRGIDGDLTRYFHLRFCLMGWWNYRRDDGRDGGQNFANRVIIPVYDLDGSFVSFQGRDITGTAERKYLFPMTLPGTGRYLYNGQNVFNTKRVTMGEGAFDVFALKKAYDEDPTMRDIVPIGSFGKHLSALSDSGDDQLARLRKLRSRGVEEVTIMWDGEKKALIAALDAAKLIAPIGLKVRIALLPFEKDPNEVLSEVVRAAHKRAKLWTPLLDMQWRIKNPYASAKTLAHIA